MGKKIGEIVGHNPDNRTYMGSDTIVSDCLVGVEVEAERLFIDIPRDGMMFNKYWKIVKDGSLRNGGAEFVLSNPLSGKDLVDGVVSLEKDVKGKELNPKFPDSTSVHIHLDVRHFSQEELYNLILIYIIFERALFNYAGPDRKDNIFCTYFDDCQAILELISAQFTQGDDGAFRDRLTRFQKYSSCNLLSVYEHGSLEFRQHVGEIKSEKILRWINILLSMHKYVQTNKIVPNNIPFEISQQGIDAFTKKVFSKYARHLDYAGLDKGVLEGIRLAQDLIHYEGMECTSYGKGEKTPFDKYLHKLGKEKPKAIIEEDWANIIFEGQEIRL